MKGAERRRAISFLGEEAHADAAADIDLFPGEGELARLGIHFEERDGVAVLMSNEHPLAGGIEIEVARDLTFRRGVLNEGQFASGGIAGEDGDGVMGAIGDINDFAIRMGNGLGGAVSLLAAIRLRQGGDGLDFGELSLLGIISEGRDRHEHLIVHKGEFATRVEGKVTRATAGRHGGVAMGSEGARGGVDLIDQDFVQTQVTGKGEAVVRAGVDAVAMGAGLAFRIHRAALMLDKGHRLTELAFFPDAVARHAAAAVVRDHGHLTGLIDRDVAGTGTDGGDLIDQVEFAIGLGDAKGTDAPGFFVGAADLADGVEVLFGRVNGQEAGAAGFSGQFRGAELARGGVEFGNVDALAARFGVGVAAEIDPVIVPGDGGGGEGGEDERERSAIHDRCDADR